jgi:NAD(P)-dependent dehydrogenase (short-subunit alcohol dehydrogenase family)
MKESVDELFYLAGRLVLLAGGAGILGSRMAHALAGHGARVAVVDRDEGCAVTVAAEVNRALSSDLVRGYACDITDYAELAKLRSRVEGDFGEVDVLLNNAAAKSPNFFEPFETFPVGDWDYVMDVNLKGVMLGCQVFGSRMAQRGRGSIINTLSIYGIVAPDQRIYEGSEYEGRAINTPAVYSASKAGVWGLTKYLASYWGHRGVRVNAITPGGVFSGQNDTFVSRYSARVPLGRMAEKDEMCGAVIFLASDASSYMTGQNLVVDGGLTVW